MLSVVLESSSLSQWLGALDGWQAALTAWGTVLGTLVGIVWPIVHSYRKQRAAAMERADRPVAPTPVPPARPSLPPVHAQLDRITRQLADVTAWSLEDARVEVRRLQFENAELRRDLEAAERYGDQLSRHVISADARAAAAVAELREHKRASTSGVSTRSATITPLRPPAKLEQA